MVGQIIDNRVIDYILASICVFIVVIKIITSLCYIRISKQSKDIDNSRGKFAGRLREYFVGEYERSDGIKNVGVLVNVYMNNVRFLGFRIAFWELAEKLSIFLCPFIGVMGMYMAYMEGKSKDVLFYYMFLAAASTGIIIIVRLLFNTGYKKKCIYMNICNHFENYVFPALEKGTYDYERQKLDKLSDEIDEGMLELIKNMDNTGYDELLGEIETKADRASDEDSKGIDLPDNEQRIFEEIINEYLT